MELPLISVIVPIYKAEDYLPRCIDSILAQTYWNIEVILVDDGSPDRCGEICDEYGQKDARVKVIHQENSGTIVARNVGLSIARGEYIGFVDSDDYIEPQMYERLYDCIRSGPYDIVWCDVVLDLADKQYASRLIASENPTKLLGQLLKGIYPGWMCNKLILRKFYDGCCLFQDKNCSMMEDVLIMTQVLYNKPRLKHIGEALYIYNQKNESALTAGNVYIRALRNIIHIESFLKDKGIFCEYYQDFSILAMRLKIALLNDDQLQYAKEIFPYAHKNLEAYPLGKSIRLVYYVFFNAGGLGRFLFCVYKIFKSKHLLNFKGTRIN